MSTHLIELIRARAAREYDAAKAAVPVTRIKMRVRGPKPVEAPKVFGHRIEFEPQNKLIGRAERGMQCNAVIDTNVVNGVRRNTYTSRVGWLFTFGASTDVIARAMVQEFHQLQAGLTEPTFCVSLAPAIEPEAKLQRPIGCERKPAMLGVPWDCTFELMIRKAVKPPKYHL